MMRSSDHANEQPVRFVIPAALLAQLRERRAEQRGYWRGQLWAMRTLGPDDTAKHFGFLPSDIEEMAAEYEFEDQEDAFLLYSGWWDTTYLTTDGRVLVRDGRVLVRDDSGSELRESTLDGAISSLVICAKTTGITELLSLVPACPDDGSQCPRCEGDRWDKPLLREHGAEIICRICHGRGWMTPAMLEAAKIS